LFLSILAFIFVLGVMIFVHELGHFLTAKWIGVKVHVFSLGFPPKLVGKQWGDTEYRIGILPLGGYVKMAGENPGEVTGNPEEFFSRTKLERIAILVMGPIMNIALTLVLFTALFMVGIERPAGLEDPPVVRFVSEDSPASRAGILPGDRILSVDGRQVENWLQFVDTFSISPEQTLALVLERDVELVERQLTVEARGKERVGYTGLFPAVQPQVVRLDEGFPAKEAGLEEGDLIIKVEGEPIYSNQELVNAIQSKEGGAVAFTVIRDGTELEYTITPQRDGDRFRIGIELPSPVTLQQYTNPLTAFGAAVGESVRITRLTFTVLGRLIQQKLSMRQMMGPIGIAQASGRAARTGIRNLFTLMAIISLQLGIFNLLPIPILDGGHVAIILLEGVARRDFSLQAKERILQVGFVLLLALMVTVIYFDLSKIDSIGRFLPWK
jgi:regulator of sigma E protease